MGTTARSTVRARMARANQLYASGTATATGTTTTLIDTTRRKELNDWWNFSQLLKTGGTGSGELADVSDFVQSTSTLTLLQTQTASDSTTTYDLFRPPFKTTHYNEAIDDAIDEAYALGFGRRGWDETLYTTRRDYYTLPTTLEEVAEVHLSAPNRLPDPDWEGSGSGWTLHADGSIGNTGDNTARALTHTIGGADRYTRTDVPVTPGVEYQFRVRVISDGTAVAVARYRFRNSAGTLLGSAATNFGTSTSATSALLTGTFTAPVGAVDVRIEFGSSSASGTVRFWEHYLGVRRWPLKVPRGQWDVEWEGNTARLVWKNVIPFSSRMVRLRGRRPLETLAADTDTVSFDAPELQAFVMLASARLWENAQGQIPDVDRGQAEDRSRFFRDRFAEVGRGNFDNWKMHRTVAVPTTE